jgi:hypothetical protein
MAAAVVVVCAYGQRRSLLLDVGFGKPIIGCLLCYCWILTDLSLYYLSVFCLGELSSCDWPKI